MVVFVNGKEIDSQFAMSRMLPDKSDLLIGRGNPDSSAGECFHGEIDALRLWNVVRTSDQLRRTINAPLTATDLSPNANHGQLESAARIIAAPRAAQKTTPASFDAGVAFLTAGADLLSRGSSIIGP